MGVLNDSALSLRHGDATFDGGGLCRNEELVTDAAAVQLENQRLRNEIRSMCATIKKQSNQLSHLWAETNLLQLRNTSTGSSLMRGISGSLLPISQDGASLAGADMGDLQFAPGKGGSSLPEEVPPLWTSYLSQPGPQKTWHTGLDYNTEPGLANSRPFNISAAASAPTMQPASLPNSARAAPPPYFCSAAAVSTAAAVSAASAALQPGSGGHGFGPSSASDSLGLLSMLGRYPSESRLPLFKPAVGPCPTSRFSSKSNNTGADSDKTNGESGPMGRSPVLDPKGQSPLRSVSPGAAGGAWPRHSGESALTGTPIVSLPNCNFVHTPSPALGSARNAGKQHHAGRPKSLSDQAANSRRSRSPSTSGTGSSKVHSSTSPEFHQTRWQGPSPTKIPAPPSWGRLLAQGGGDIGPATSPEMTDNASPAYPSPTARSDYSSEAKGGPVSRVLSKSSEMAVHQAVTTNGTSRKHDHGSKNHGVVAGRTARLPGGGLAGHRPTVAASHRNDGGAETSHSSPRRGNALHCHELAARHNVNPDQVNDGVLILSEGLAHNAHEPMDPLMSNGLIIGEPLSATLYGTYPEPSPRSDNNFDPEVPSLDAGEPAQVPESKIEKKMAIQSKIHSQYSPKRSLKERKNSTASGTAAPRVPRLRTRDFPRKVDNLTMIGSLASLDSEEELNFDDALSSRASSVAGAKKPVGARMGRPVDHGKKAGAFPQQQNVWDQVAAELMTKGVSPFAGQGHNLYGSDNYASPLAPGSLMQSQASLKPDRSIVQPMLPSSTAHKDKEKAAEPEISKKPSVAPRSSVASKRDSAKSLDADSGAQQQQQQHQIQPSVPPTPDAQKTQGSLDANTAPSPASSRPASERGPDADSPRELLKPDVATPDRTSIMMDALAAATVPEAVNSPQASPSPGPSVAMDHKVSESSNANFMHAVRSSTTSAPQASRSSGSGSESEGGESESDFERDEEESVDDEEADATPKAKASKASTPATEAKPAKSSKMSPSPGKKDQSSASESDDGSQDDSGSDDD